MEHHNSIIYHEQGQGGRGTVASDMGKHARNHERNGEYDGKAYVYIIVSIINNHERNGGKRYLSVKWSVSMKPDRCILRRSGQLPSVSTRASPSFFSSYSSLPVVLQCTRHMNLSAIAH